MSDRENCDPCKIPYIAPGGKNINIFPNECVLNDDTWKYLFFEAKRAILTINPQDILRNLSNEKDYKNLFLIAQGIAQKIKGRVVITLPDGHVVIDTCKGDGNTYENYLKDIITENHNTRIAIFQAQCDRNGIGYEKKFSSTTDKYEIYLAVRLGPFRDSAGTLRLSVIKQD